MKYNFDEIIDRQGTYNIKWDTRDVVFGTTDVLPMSIADMDIAVAPPITEAIRKRTEHPLYGYNVDAPNLFQAVANWCERRHNWLPNYEHILPLPGVVPGIAFAIQALSKKGDGIIVQTPVYPPFLETIGHTERRLVENPLINKDGYYTMDYADLEEKAKDPNTTLLILCNPHNPVGRVYTREELTKLYEICARHNVFVIADEIHSDVTYKGHNHTMFASLHKEAEEHCIMFVSVSKTFNLAGLSTAFAIIPNGEVRAKFQHQLDTLHMTRTNIFGAVATVAAYTECDEWVDDMLAYMEANVDYMVGYMKEHLPKVTVHKPEGTYLVWLDFRAYFKENGKLEEFLINEAKLGLNLGLPYGQPGEGFARMDIAVPRKVLEEAMGRLYEAFKKL